MRELRFTDKFVDDVQYSALHASFIGRFPDILGHEPSLPPLDPDTFTGYPRGQELAVTDVDMRPVDAASKHRPEALEGRARLADIFAELVAHFGVLIAHVAKRPVGPKRVRMDVRSGQHMLLNDRNKGAGFRVLDDARNQLAAVFEHPDYECLVANVAATPRAMRLAANQGFINLHRLSRTTKRIVVVERGHVSTDLRAHTPRRFVGDTKLALDTFCRDAVPRRRKQKHDVEPIAQRPTTDFDQALVRRHSQAAPV